MRPFQTLVHGILIVAKNISWIASSATRAHIHNRFALENNLGDVTGKSGSQNTAAGLMGTGMGVIFSTLLGGNTFLMIMCFLPLATLSIYANYKSNTFVVSDVLNLQRMELSFQSSILNGKVLSPNEISERELFVRKFHSPYKKTILVEPLLDEICKKMSICENDLRQIFADQNRLYYLYIKDGKIALWFHVEAKASDIHQGFFHCYYLIETYGIDTMSMDHIYESQKIVEAKFKDLENQMNLMGWNMQDTFLACRKRRIEIIK